MATSKKASGTKSTKSNTSTRAAKSSSARGGSKEAPLRLRSSHATAASKATAKPKKGAAARARASLPKGAPVDEPRGDVAPKPSVRERKLKVPGESVATDESRSLAVEIAIAAIEKKAVGLEVIDVAGRVDYADFLVIMSGRSPRQVAALAQSIEEALGRKGRRVLSVEGLPHATWVLMDYGDVVVHVLHEEARGAYNLDALWLDARRIPVSVPDEAR